MLVVVAVDTVVTAIVVTVKVIPVISGTVLAVVVDNIFSRLKAPHLKCILVGDIDCFDIADFKCIVVAVAVET